MVKETGIKISREGKKFLASRGMKGDTFEDIIMKQFNRTPLPIKRIFPSSPLPIKKIFDSKNRP